MSAGESHEALRAKVRAFIDETCIARVPRGSKELPAIGGGGHYTWQFYLRAALLNPDCLKLIACTFWDRFGAQFDIEPFQVAGVEAAAVPMITAIILEGASRGIDVPAFCIRKERKAYGLRNLIEGNPNSSPVVFVDDLTSPLHRAFWHAVSAIKDARLTMASRAFVLVLKNPKGQEPIIPTSFGDISIDYIYTLTDFGLAL